VIFQDEVVASSEKVVLRVSDLVQWMGVGGVEWRWGHRPSLVKEEARAPAHVVVLSFPRYCRYRSVAKRLEGEQKPQHAALGVALGGLADPKPRTAVLFCRDNFDCPELEAHELLCNHLGQYGANEVAEVPNWKFKLIFDQMKNVNQKHDLMHDSSETKLKPAILN
jgi:hypothetical protein